MFARTQARLLPAADAFLLALVPAGDVRIRDGHDLVDTVQATGAGFETEEELADNPRATVFRAFLPTEVDLRDRVPNPGGQGEQRSWFGWQVGHAARFRIPHVGDRADVATS